MLYQRQLTAMSTISEMEKYSYQALGELGELVGGNRLTYTANVNM